MPTAGGTEITMDEGLLSALYSCTEGNVLFLDIALNAMAGEPIPKNYSNN